MVQRYGAGALPPVDTEPQQVGEELSTCLLIKIIRKTTGYRESYLELLYNLPWWSSCPIFDISILNSNFNYDYEYVTIAKFQKAPISGWKWNSCRKCEGSTAVRKFSMSRGFWIWLKQVPQQFRGGRVRATDEKSRSNPHTSKCFNRIGRKAVFIKNSVNCKLQTVTVLKVFKRV